MRRTPIRVIAAGAVALCALSLTQAVADEDDDRPGGERRLRPIVFVHGFAGSGAQFETQALRFTSNGYPPEHIAFHEYDSLFSVETREEVFARLDRRIAELLDASRADKVDLLGHSLGTTLMHEYLNSAPDRAAKVAHYVNLDGRTAASPPGGVPTLAVWGKGDPARKIGDASNLYFTNQTHTQVVTSVETFEEIYTFFTGKEPQTTDVVPERGDRLRLAGRAIIFPQNTGVDNGTLEIHEVNGATGARIDDRAEATYPLRGDGAWGPFNAHAGRNYEFAIVRQGAAIHHLYYEPFTRSDHWVRLLTSPPTGGIGDLIKASDRHAALVILRYKEWWGDQGPNSDVLEVNGLNILNAANSPIDKRAIAVFAFDAGSDGVTNLATPIPSLFGLPFITGVDVVIPGAEPPKETISIASTPRNGGGRVELINVPNLASSTHRISVQFNEYVED
jgi:pimeloyl-ACP methyl ester carboxylesterase